VKCICQICRKEFFIYESDIKNGRGKYCSKECMNIAFKETRLGEKHPNWKGGKIKHICKDCGREFLVEPSALKHGRGKYCSKECKDMSQQRETNPLRKKTKEICENCGGEFLVMPYVLRNGMGKYCSQKCAKTAMSGENSPMWKGGSSFFPYCEKFNTRRKEAVREFFGRVCLICGSTEAEFSRRLSVHHIDHDKEQGCGGKPFNLVPLCHACHAKEIFREEEFRIYINKTLDEGFKWGIWNKEEYIKKVMYPDD
jgi:hypothetical protein